MKGMLNAKLVLNNWRQVDINFAPMQILNTIAYKCHAYHISTLAVYNNF